jgi:predicted alpha/beta hydrolase
MTSTTTLSISASDQHQFSAELYSPANEHVPILIFYPALGTPAKIYRNIAEEFVAHGIAVCTPDWRGIGTSSIRASRRSNFGYRHLVEIDAPALIAEIQTRFPNAPIWVGGHSLGGQLSSLIAASTPVVRGFLPIASGSVYLPCFSPRVQRQVHLIGFLNRIAGPLLGYFPGNRIGFGGREASGLMRDWYQVARSGRYQPAGSEKDYEAALTQLRIPALGVNFQHDNMATASAAEYLLGKLKSCKTERWNWTAAETEGIELDHYSWLKHPKVVVPRIAAWILSKTEADK